MFILLSLPRKYDYICQVIQFILPATVAYDNMKLEADGNDWWISKNGQRDQFRVGNYASVARTCRESPTRIFFFNRNAAIALQE